MDESNINETTKAEEQQGDGGEPKKRPENGLTDFVHRLKDVQNKKANARASRWIDLFCFAAVVALVIKFKAADLPTPNNSLMYYREDAYVVDMEYIGTDEGKQWHVILEYRIGSEQVYKDMYYKKKPKFREGDTVILKVETINPDRIEVEGRK